MSTERPIPNRKDTRKALYALLGNAIGRELTASEHKAVKEIIEEYIKGVFNGLDINQTPRTHLLKCTECAAKSEVVGNRAIRNIYKGKRRGFTAS